MKVSAEYLRTVQNRLDQIGNNLANTMTTGFKEALLSLEESYDVQDRSNTVAQYGGVVPGGEKPVLTPNLYAGKRLDFGQGSLTETGNPLDMAILGEGFFQIRTSDGKLGYTRAGLFSWDGEGNLVNNEGFLAEPAVKIPANAVDITIEADGTIKGVLREETAEDSDGLGDFDDFGDFGDFGDFDLGDFGDFGDFDLEGSGEGSGAETEDKRETFGQISLFKFANPNGLEQAGHNLYLATEASGAAIAGVSGKDGFGEIKTGMLERSNTDVVSAMTNLIQAQRAYQIDLQMIKDQDQMAQQAIAMRG